MKTKILKIIWFLSSISFLFNSQISFCKLNFRLERLSTDYNGVVYDGKNVLAYGNYGVITYSTDKGKTWKQISLGEHIEILKILYIKDYLYALTPYSILKSADNPLNWRQRKFFDEPNLRDIAFDEKYIYLASTNAIFRTELDLNGELETIVLFDEFSSISEMVYIKNYLFCIDGNYFLYRINLQTNPIDTIDLHQTVLRSETNVRNLSHIKVYDSTIYVLAESIFQNNSKMMQPEYADHNICHCLIKSENLGSDWKIVTRNIRLTKEYQIFDGLVYFLTQKGIKDSLNSSYYYTIRYYKINPDGNEEEINKEAILDYRIPIFTGGFVDVTVPNTFGVNMFVRIENNTLIAVGPNKTILKSTNNGMEWFLVSYFKPLGTIDEFKVKFLGIDTILVFCGLRPYFFKSFDGGATFLPPKRNVENFPEMGGQVFIINETAFGFIERKTFSHIEKIDDTTNITRYDSTYFYFYLTTDLGEIFLKKGFYRNHIFTTDSVFYSLDKVGVIQGKILCLFSAKQTKPIDTIYNSYFYFFDKSLNVIDSVEQSKIPYLSGENLLIEDSVIYCLASPFLYFSKDFGKSWEILYTNLYGLNYFKIHFKSLLLISHWKQIAIGKYENKLLVFDLMNSFIDTLLISGRLNFFVFNDTLFAYTRDYKYLFFFPFGKENLNVIDSIEVFSTPRENINFIVDGITNGLDKYFLILKENGSGFLNKLYEVNIAKVIYDEQKYLPVVPEIEKNFLYLFNFSPYPIPASEFLTCQLFWDLPYKASDIKIAILDILGNNQERAKCIIETIDTNSGILRVDCSNLPNGVYTAILTLKNKNVSIPFIVLK